MKKNYTPLIISVVVFGMVMSTIPTAFESEADSLKAILVLSYMYLTFLFYYMFRTDKAYYINSMFKDMEKASPKAQKDFVYKYYLCSLQVTVFYVIYILFSLAFGFAQTIDAVVFVASLLYFAYKTYFIKLEE